MDAYDVTGWSDFFVASAGATAALAGLVFVAASINIDRVLQFQGVPEFAMVTLLLLVGVLLISLLGLVPGQSTEAYGIELLLSGFVWGVAVVPRVRVSIPKDGADRHLASRVALPSAGILPLAVGAVSLIAGSGGGLYWLAAGFVITIFAAVVNAWILLIEILR